MPLIKSKAAKWTIGVIVAIVWIPAVQVIFRANAGEESIEQIAASLNAKCPIVAEDQAQIDSVVADGRTLVFDVTFLQPMNMDIFSEQFTRYRPVVLKNISVRTALQHGIPLRIVYHNQRHTRMIIKELSPADLKPTPARVDSSTT